MLRALRLNKEKEILQKERAAKEESRAAFLLQSEELTRAIDEAETKEDIDLVEEKAGEVERGIAEADAAIEGLDEKIGKIDEELRSIEEKAGSAGKGEQNAEKRKGTTGMAVRANKYETREEMLARLEREEVREFYSMLAKAASNKRALTGTDALVPEVVVNMVQTRLGDYAKLYSEVTVERLSGDARVIMDGAIPEGVWTECCDPVSELAGAFSETELDCYKVGGFIPICNATLEDSMINLANYVEQRLAWAIAKALDKAILTGAVASNMPTGVIPSIPAGNQVTSDGTLGDIVGKLALIDDGEDGPPIGEVIAVMKRSTYYNRIASQTLLPTADGRYVVQTASTPYLPDGTRVVFSQYVPTDVIILGDFKKYILGERAGIKLAVSTDVRFIEDQTVFKGTARYDGKPAYADMFVQVTITDTP